MWLHYIICQQTNINFNDENNENRMELWKWKSNEKKHITNIIWENILILTKRIENDEIMHRGNESKIHYISVSKQAILNRIDVDDDDDDDDFQTNHHSSNCHFCCCCER